MTQQHDVVADLKREVWRWQRRAFVSTMALVGIALATCANYTATDDLVARRKLDVGETGARVHVENGVVTIIGADGAKTVINAKGMTVLDAKGSAKAVFPAKK